MTNAKHVLYLCTLFSCLVGFGFSEESGKTGVIAIARCRSRCLAKFINKGNRETTCQEATNCIACWNVCEPIFSDYNKWRDVCKKNLCGPGCRVACKFRKKPASGEISDNFQFSEIPAVTVENEKRLAYMAWNVPKASDTSSAKDLNLVYVLLSRDLAQKNRNWQQRLQTEETGAMLDLSTLPHDQEFWLLAVGEKGTMTGIRFNTTIPEQLIYTGHVDVPDKISLPSKHSPTITFEESPLHLFMNMTSSNRRLYYDLYWEHPSNITRRGFRDYQIYIYLDHCDCDEDPDYKSTIVSFNNSVKPHYRLKGIIYNAQYRVQVTLTSDERLNGTVRFNTPNCEETHPLYYTICRHDTYNIPKVETKTTSTRSPLTASPSPQSRSPAIEYSQKDNIIVPGWNVSVVSKKYDQVSRHVFVQLKWACLFNDTTTEIIWINSVHDKYTDSGREQFSVLDTNTATVELKLKPDNLYRVKVIATYEDGDDSKRFTSETIEINTNVTDSMPRVEASRRALIDKEKEIFNGIILGVTILASVIIFGIIIVFIYKKRQSFRDIIITKTAVAKSNSYKSNVGCKVDYSNQILITSDDWEVDFRQLKLSGHIGQGAFGKVVTGYYNDQRVAVKLVRDSAPLSYKEDLLAEIALMKRLGSHPNIVSMIGACTIMEPICLVMEYVPYGNLQNFLKKCRLEGELSVNSGHIQELNYSLMDEHGGINEGIVTPADLLSFARQVAMAMVAWVINPLPDETNFRLVQIEEVADDLSKFLGIENHIAAEHLTMVSWYVSNQYYHNILSERLKQLISLSTLYSKASNNIINVEYLAEKKYVHRDLAARNVLLGYDKIIKVCDFGLSRDIYNDNQYKKLTNGKLPLKWMAIESLRDRVFTTQSDVWSFGILLWEIVTMGASPYPNIALADLYYLLSNHYRMEKPSNCSDELYIIMRQCWLDKPEDRPSFTDLRVQLELLLLREGNYLELDNINVPLSTPETSSASPVSDDTASLLAAQALQPQRKSSKDELTVDVCVHEKSVEKLLKRKGDFDAHNITIL